MTSPASTLGPGAVEWLGCISPNLDKQVVTVHRLTGVVRKTVVGYLYIMQHSDILSVTFICRTTNVTDMHFRHMTIVTVVMRTWVEILHFYLAKKKT